MIQFRKYQMDAIEQLKNHIYTLLKLDGAKHRLVFKAPTGAGKTITVAGLLEQINRDMPMQPEMKEKEIAYIWIAPNTLHEQSYKSIKNHFKHTHELQPIHFEDIHKGLKAKQILFINWESINKDDNKFIKQGETGRDLTTYIENTRSAGIEIVCILDEEHLFANGDKSKKILTIINPKIILGVSATPLEKSDYTVVIQRKDAIEAQIIKKKINLNPSLSTSLEEGISMNHNLMEIALHKRDELKLDYEAIGKNINPLLLIQLPNDTQKNNTQDDITIRDSVFSFYANKGITVENGKLAIWMSETKLRLEFIEKNDSIVEVLLFKEAIAKGWDCPRAAVLLIFREIKTQSFTVQTVGRIMRMPEQTHYANESLNVGYVYTNIASNHIQVVAEDANYLLTRKAIRKQGINVKKLMAKYIQNRVIRNRLNYQFKNSFYNSANTFFGIKLVLLSDRQGIDTNIKRMQEKLIEMDAAKIEVKYISDEVIGGDEEVIITQQYKFAKTESEIDQLFKRFCYVSCGNYAKADSYLILHASIVYLFESYFDMEELEVGKIILYDQNQPIFIEFIAKALVDYTEFMQEQDAKKIPLVKEITWEIPSERLYNEEFYNEVVIENNHALTPFFQEKIASNPELKFINWLESKKNQFEWWYKNGNSGTENFSITYNNSTGEEKTFYPDFIAFSKTGTTYILDTKTKGSDLEAVQKHNALIDYVNSENLLGAKLFGSILLYEERQGNHIFEYSQNKIENEGNISNWQFFNNIVEY